MTRRTAAICALVAVASLLTTAGPASAAQSQDFYYGSTNGVRVAVAKGVVVNGIGTFTPANATTDTLVFAGRSITAFRTVASRTELFDARTCATVVRESGGFRFSFGSVEGRGSYVLTSTRTGRRLLGGGCDLGSPALVFAVAAHTTDPVIID